MDTVTIPTGEAARVASPPSPTEPGEGTRNLPPDGRDARPVNRAYEVREFFNRRAADWDLTQDPLTLERSRRLVLSLGIEPGSRVLDVGCGTGILIPGLLEAVGEEGSVCAVDVAEEMLKVARSKLQRPNLHYLQADMAATPFLDESFDLVICHNCFPHVVEKRRAVREMFRVLRPGGRAVISHTEDRETVNARHLRLGGAVGGDLLPDEATMRRWFREAGFEVIEIRDGGEGYLLQARKPDARAGGEAEGFPGSFNRESANRHQGGHKGREGLAPAGARPKAAASEEEGLPEYVLREAPSILCQPEITCNQAACEDCPG